jgi:Mg-chelatase subunit ChlD
VSDHVRKTRWRLILGDGGDQSLGGCSGEMAERDKALGFLYDREYKGRNVRRNNAGASEGTLDPSNPYIADWINHVHELFPKQTIERLERDALERYQIHELVTNAELLSRTEPSQSLLKAILHTKHLMNQDVLAVAKSIVRRVVQDIFERLARQVQAPFFGARNRSRRSYIKVAKNFDARSTIRRNLHRFDLKSRRLFIETPYFNTRIRRQVDKWQLIILVDESGSMVENIIHAAVTAAIFHNLQSLKTHLILFDTNVVDVSETCFDAVETIMKVQLGGGTDIGKAMQYAMQLVDNPKRTIVVLISDFFEGGYVARLLDITKRMTESGVTLLGLAALNKDAEPIYNKELAQAMVELGAHVGAMTPGELASWLAERVR